MDDDAVIAGYEHGVASRWVRVNFVSSVDGSATLAGRSGALSDAADKRVFTLLRHVCDVVLVGAGTVRAEGYSGELVDAEARRWREAHGFAAHPTLAIVTGEAALDPGSELFRRSPVRPIVITRVSADRDRVAALTAVADVVECGGTSVDLRQALDALAERGLRRVQCEGGPHLLGALTAADAVDELCLTVSPVLVGGNGPRIATGSETDRSLRVGQVLRSDDTLLLRYVRAD
nr:pyrimidine reductase family protein [Planctomonas sp. JC2975]